MFKNYITSAFRNLLKNRWFSLIHIGGLSIGLTAGIYVIHYARIEYGYDKFHYEAKQIYRVVTTRIKDGIELTKFSSTYSGVGPAMKDEYPEVESYTRMVHRWRGGIISYGETRFREQKIYNVDSGFLKVFSFPIIAGSANDLMAPGMAFVEQVTAKKYFGDENPIGKRISFGGVDGNEEYEIRGIVQCPETSSIKFTFLLSYHSLGRFLGTNHLSNWQWLDFHTFVRLKDQTDPKIVESRFPELLKKFRGDRASNSRLSLQQFPEIYLNSKTEFETGLTGDKNTVRILLALGIIIIIIVALNFVNLYTSHAITRAKEVGIRKTLGSSRQNLVVQFLTETATLNLLAMLICVILLWALLPYFNQLAGKSLTFTDFANNYLWKYMVTFLVFGTLGIGAYPALQLSAFRPAEVLKGFFSPKGYGAFLREAFVGFQALVSFSLVAAILIVIDQVRYVNGKDLNIAIENTLVVRAPELVTTPREYISSLDVYKSELSKDTHIMNVCTTADSPGEDVNWIGGTRKLGSEPVDAVSFYRSIIDEDYLETMDLKIVSGEDFRKGQSDHDILINQSGAKAIGFATEESTIGERIIAGIDTFTVRGVVEDFHHVSPREAIAPTLYHFNLETPRLILVKFNSNNPESVVQLAQTAFARLFPNEPFDYYFLDEFFDKQYTIERRLTMIITVFCVLAVIVSALGLLGLTWFRLSVQKKELAIRKILGSSNLQLFIFASRKLFRTTLAGCLIGIPLTWYVMQQWLQSFSVHTHPHVWEFCVALVCSLAIAFLTVTGHTLKIISTNPVNHLKQE
jgi:putative ABC transport system permease protein